MTPRDKALILWENYSREYRRALEDYESAKRELRRLRISTRVVPNSTIREYPEITFLRIEEECEVKLYLMGLTQPELDKLIESIEDLPFNYSYTTIRSYLIDAEWKIKHHGRKRPLYGCYGSRGGGIKRSTPKIILRYEQ